MISLEQLEIKKLNKTELKTLVDWAREEGWNPGISDYEVFWNTDPEGFYGFFHKDELIAGGAVVSYENKFGFMGLFIVKPRYRGHGIGKKLWYLRRDLLLERLNDNAPIGMDGVVAMQPFYEKGGFRRAYNQERYECKGRSLSVSNEISELVEADFEVLLPYDLTCFGFKRTEFLRAWINNPQCHGFKYSRNSELLGYAIIRKVNIGYKIGPLFADNYEVAESLFRACLNVAEGASVFMDIPMINPNAVRLVQEYGGKYTFECARMYHGEAPNLAINKIFGVTSFELG